MAFTISQTPKAKTITLRPNGTVFDCLNLSKYGIGGSNNYPAVNEEICDEDLTYVYSDATIEISDLYEMDDTVDTGDINYIKMYAWAKSADYMPSSDATFKIIYGVDISECSLAYESENFELTTGYKRYHTIETDSPYTYAPWTWDEVEDLVVGIRCSSPTLTIDKTTWSAPTDDVSFPTAYVNLLTTDDAMTGTCHAGEHYDQINSPIKNENTYVYTEENWVSRCAATYTNKACGTYYYSTDQTLFVADGNKLIAYYVINGEYMELGTETTYGYRLVWMNETSGTIFAATTSTLYALSWDGANFSVLHSVTPTNYIYGLSGNANHIVVTSYDSGTNRGSFKSYTYSGGFTLKDTETVGADNDSFMKCCVDSDGYFWVLYAKYSTNSYIVNLYSVNAGTGAITLLDDYTQTGLRFDSGNELISDANYTYIGNTQGASSGPMCIALDYSGGNIIKKGEWRAPNNPETSNQWRSAIKISYDGTYLYLQTWSIDDKYKLTFDGTTFTLISNSYGVETNIQYNSFSAVDEFLYYGHRSLRTHDILDMYEMNIPIDTGVIENVSLYARCMTTNNMIQSGKFLTNTGGGIEEAGDLTITGPWSNYALKLTTNPETGIAWTWTDISNLEIGLKFGDGDRSGDTKCCQYYIIVTYKKENYSPEIRTSQVYAEVNYQPEDAYCSLNTPEEISKSVSRNVKMINFWNGTREVYTTTRAGKTMVMQGGEFGDGSCDRILCVRELALDGSPVTVSGLSLELFNGVYHIRSFGWNKVSNKPEHYKWILELEDTE